MAASSWNSISRTSVALLKCPTPTPARHSPVPRGNHASRAPLPGSRAHRFTGVVTQALERLFGSTSSYTAEALNRKAQVNLDTARTVRAVLLKRTGVLDVADMILEYHFGSAVGHDLQSFLLPRGAGQGFLDELTSEYNEAAMSCERMASCDATLCEDPVGSLQAFGEFSGYHGWSGRDAAPRIALPRTRSFLIRSYLGKNG